MPQLVCCAVQVLSIVDRVDPEGAEEPEFKVRDLMGVQYVPLTPPSDSEADSGSLSDDAPAMHVVATGAGGDASGTCDAPERHSWRAADPAPGAAT